MDEIRQIKKKTTPMAFVILGMISACLLASLFFFSMDKTKGWNPYGWWFMATFASAILGGLAGLFLFAYKNKSKK